jgi:hypothetical protein
MGAYTRNAHRSAKDADCKLPLPLKGPGIDREWSPSGGYRTSQVEFGAEVLLNIQ